MARSEDPVLILVVFGYNLVLKSSTGICKLGLDVLPARRSERHGGIISLTLLLVPRLLRRVCLQLPLLIVLAKCSTTKM
jgi:hypothetical protein